MRSPAALLILLLPMQAQALSCAAPSVERSFQQASNADADYVVVHGRLVFDIRKLPGDGTSSYTPPKQTRIPATLRGRSLTSAGFKVPFERQLTLEVSCFGPWCGSAQSGQDVLAFVRRDSDGYVLEISPCDGNIFGNPKPEMLKTAERCFSSGACAAR